jgi:hypothetical protein
MGVGLLAGTKRHRRQFALEGAHKEHMSMVLARDALVAGDGELPLVVA